MDLFRRWMLLLVRKLTFWSPPPPPCYRDPAELRASVGQTYYEPVKELQSGVWRISDAREYPGVSYESSGTVVACMMVTDMEAPETLVLKTDRGLKECACGALLFKCLMWLGRKSLG